ncbi:MAG: FAD-dependent oxidoreductase [Candidatus Omnitrophota bacterium]
MKVAIIGAGISGLLNAYRLSGKHQVTIYEQSKHIGGLCAGFESDGKYIDKYNHFFSKSDKELIELITDLGINKKISWKKTKQCLVENNQLQDLSNPFNLFTLNGLRLTTKLRTGIFLTENLFSKMHIALNDQTAENWIIKKCGIAAFNLLFMPLLNFKTQKTEDISAMYLKARLKERKNNTIGNLQGGMHSLLLALRDKLHRDKTHIWLNSKVKNIIRDEKNKWQVSLDSGTEEYDLVIACVSLVDAAALFIANPGFMVPEYLNVGSWVLELNQPLNQDFWIALVDDQQNNRHVVVNTLPINNENRIYFSFYSRDEPITESIEKAMFNNCCEGLKKINPNFNQDWIKQKSFHSDQNAEPVFTQNFVAKLYGAVDSLHGLYLPDLVYVPQLIKTINTSVLKSSIIRQRIRKEFKV